MTTYLKLECQGNTIAVCKITDKKMVSVSNEYIHVLSGSVQEKLSSGFQIIEKDEFDKSFKKEMCKLLDYL